MNYHLSWKVIVIPLDFIYRNPINTILNLMPVMETRKVDVESVCVRPQAECWNCVT